MKPFYIASLVLGIAANLHAQQATPQPSLPPLPPGPLLKRAPDFSTWTVTYKGHLEGVKPATTGEGDSKDPEAKEPGAMASTVVKTGATILELNTDHQGKRKEIWHLGGVMVVKLPDAAEPVVWPDSAQPFIYSINFAASDFAGLDWISAKTYAGMAKYQGRECIAFKGDVSPLTPRAREEEAIAIGQAKAFGQPVPQELRVPATAYIDLETRLPLLVMFGQETRVYQYGAPPSAPLALTPELAATLKEYVKHIERLSAPAAKPY